MSRIVSGTVGCLSLLMLLAACGDPPDAPSPAAAAAAVSADPGYRLVELGSSADGDGWGNAINGRGDVAGLQTMALDDGTIGERAFFFDAAASAMLDVGAALAKPQSEALDVNDEREVVGHEGDQLLDPFDRNAFYWSAGTGYRSLHDPARWVSSSARAINRRGVIVGAAGFNSGAVRCVVWDRTGALVRQFAGPRDADCELTDIDDRGAMVGNVWRDGVPHATLWGPLRNARDLGSLGGSWSVALAIAASGMVVGYAETAGGEVHGFSWTEAGGMRDHERTSSLYGVNEGGRVVGIGMLPYAVTEVGDQFAQLPKSAGDVFGFASDVNRCGTITGGAQTAGSFDRIRAVIWTTGGDCRR